MHGYERLLTPFLARTFSISRAGIFAGRIALNTARIYRATLEHNTHHSQVVVASFPRSGTTWMQWALHLMLRPDAPHPPRLVDASPALERLLLKRARPLVDISGGIFKTHLPYRLCPSGDARIVYVMRDGLDVAVSLYYHTLRYGGVVGDINDFAYRFVSGVKLYPQRTWYQHVDEWLRNTRGLPLLVVRYEDIVANPVAVLINVAQFCGVSLASGRADVIARQTSFSAMRADESRFDPSGRPCGAALYDHFIRRGQPGEHRDVLAQSLIDKHIRMCRKYRSLHAAL